MNQLTFDMPFDKYAALPAWNQSALKEALKSPALAYHARDNRREETDALRMGSLFDTFLFDGMDAAVERFAVAPKFDRRTKEGKAAYAEFADKNQGKTLVDEEQWVSTVNMHASLVRHPLYERYIGSAKTQAVFQCEHPSGLSLKGRFDALAGVDGLYTIVDVKTTGKTASRHGFARSISEFGYDFQLAMYAMGLEACEAIEADVQVVLCVIETYPWDGRDKHGVAFYSLDQQALYAGRQKVEKAIEAVCAYDPDVDGDEGQFLYPTQLQEIRPAW